MKPAAIGLRRPAAAAATFLRRLGQDGLRLGRRGLGGAALAGGGFAAAALAATSLAFLAPAWRRASARSRGSVIFSSGGSVARPPAALAAAAAAWPAGFAGGGLGRPRRAAARACPRGGQLLRSVSGRPSGGAGGRHGLGSRRRRLRPRLGRGGRRPPARRGAGAGAPAAAAPPARAAASFSLSVSGRPSVAGVGTSAAAAAAAAAGTLAAARPPPPRRPRPLPSPRAPRRPAALPPSAAPAPFPRRRQDLFHTRTFRHRSVPASDCPSIPRPPRLRGRSDSESISRVKANQVPPTRLPDRMILSTVMHRTYGISPATRSRVRILKAEKAARMSFPVLGTSDGSGNATTIADPGADRHGPPGARCRAIVPASRSGA